MSVEKTRKIREAIADCNNYIAKESARSADLRPVETAALLVLYKAHRAKLQAMLGVAS